MSHERKLNHAISKLCWGAGLIYGDDAPLNLQLLAQRLLALRVLVAVLLARHLLVLHPPRVLHHWLQLQLYHPAAPNNHQIG